MAKIVVIASLADSLFNFRGPLLRGMVGAGHTVIACAPSSSSMSLEKLTNLGVSFHSINNLDRTGNDPFRDVRFLANLVCFFRSVSPDIVLSYTAKPVLYASIAAKIAGVRQIYSIITGLGYAFINGSGEQKGLALLIRMMYTFSLNWNKRVFFQNPDDRDFFLKKKILLDSQKAVLVSGSGVDIDYYSIAPFPKEGPSFLLIARMLRNKGVREYVEAARILKQRYPGVIFRLLGWHDPNPDAISLDAVRMWEQEGVIEYIEETKDVRPYIANASVYVLPSYREGTPRTVLEAMAMGRPIITSDAPGCRETVINGWNGFLVPVKDKLFLAATMERFIHDPMLIEVMGKRSREYVVKKFDARKVVAVMMEAMELSRV